MGVVFRFCWIGETDNISLPPKKIVHVRTKESYVAICGQKIDKEIFRPPAFQKLHENSRMSLLLCMVWYLSYVP